MTGESNLNGLRILVVEDEYYIATDIAGALQRAGAIILGPCRSDADARLQIGKNQPDAVVLDINLGQGASFKLAEYLNDTGIPFVFVTGYDNATIPAEFQGFARLTKPIQLRQIVRAIWQVSNGRALA